ncbi:MAG: bacteriohemerythrin [Pseudomonadota bacterium]
MAFFDWKEDYSVGIQKIDLQHKKLVGYLNDLYEAMRAGHGKDALEKVLNGLVSYTKTHFADEEKLMADGGYPDVDAHRQKHEKMAAKVGAFYQQYREGTISNPIQITNFLKDWLVKHIMETDRQYGPYLNAKGIH